MMTKEKIEEIVVYIQGMANSEEAGFEAAEYLDGIAAADPEDYHRICAYVGTDATDGIENVANFILGNSYMNFMTPSAFCENELDGDEFHDLVEFDESDVNDCWLSGMMQ